MALVKKIIKKAKFVISLKVEIIIYFNGSSSYKYIKDFTLRARSNGMIWMHRV